MGNVHYAKTVRAHLDEKKDVEGYAARFDANLQNQKKSMLIVSIPLLAIVMSVVFLGSGRTFAEHLVLSVQVYTFLLLYLLAATLVLFIPLRSIPPEAVASSPILWSAIYGELGIGLIAVTGLTLYMYKATGRAYALSRGRALVSGLVLALAMLYLTGVYNHLLFWATFWTT
jgi:hypothetical protein